MIFVTVGHKEFDRLASKMDSLSESLGQEVVIQIGDKPGYLPKDTKYFFFLGHKEIDNYFAKAELIVSHCSIGVLLRAQKHSKPIIAVPRQYALKEHVDDHQVDFAKMLVEEHNTEGMKFVYDIEELAGTIEQVLQNKTGVILKSFGQKEKLINTLRSFVSSLNNQK